MASLLEQQLPNMVNKLHILIREQLRQDMEQSTLDKIFTMFETWLKLDQDLSREPPFSILQRIHLCSCTEPASAQELGLDLFCHTRPKITCKAVKCKGMCSFIITPTPQQLY